MQSQVMLLQKDNKQKQTGYVEFTSCRWWTRHLIIFLVGLFSHEPGLFQLVLQSVHTLFICQAFGFKNLTSSAPSKETKPTTLALHKFVRIERQNKHGHNICHRANSAIVKYIHRFQWLKHCKSITMKHIIQYNIHTACCRFRAVPYGLCCTCTKENLFTIASLMM